MTELSRLDKARLRFLEKQLQSLSNTSERRVKTIEARHEKALNDLAATVGESITSLVREIASLKAKQ